jgi:MarR family transcriptional regulator for hemolysin
MWRQQFDAKLSASGQTFSRAIALYYIAEAGEKLTQTELARLLCLEGPTVARLLDGLEHSGMVKRAPSQTDRRVNYVVLMPDAMPVVEETSRVVRQLRMELLGGIEEDKLSVAIDVLQQISRKLS